MKIKFILYTFQKKPYNQTLNSLKKTNHTMCLLKILTDQCFQEQNIKTKSIIACLV